MELRPAEPADLGRLIAVDPSAERDPSRRSLLESSTRRGECWLAESSGTPVGFVVLQYSFYGHGFVALVVVDVLARRRGVGRRLLEHAASVCTTPKLFTSTNASNTAMRSLLPRVGFEPSGVIRNLDPGDEELVFVRKRESA
jgi:ribosomal protein S18 acetylase RimI-like enzyme